MKPFASAKEFREFLDEAAREHDKRKLEHVDLSLLDSTVIQDCVILQQPCIHPFSKEKCPCEAVMEKLRR